MQLADNGRPVLWQLEISHYNEKVRWALDYKRIPHVRRALLPGVHMFVTKYLTGDTPTTPVLTLDGRSIGDSTRIIAAVEERWPEPRLYPKNAAQRRRALRLEEFFDEELGPHIRLAAYHELLSRPDLVRPLFEHGQPPVARALIRVGWPVFGMLIRRHFAINEQSAADSRARVQAAMDRLEAEIRPSGYLVGDSFSVADLTAAALFYPVVQPPEFPYPGVRELPPAAREFLHELALRPGGQWVREMYRRHRRPADEGHP
jgi:glutathione S-transferase